MSRDETTRPNARDLWMSETARVACLSREVDKLEREKAAREAWLSEQFRLWKDEHAPRPPSPPEASTSPEPSSSPQPEASTTEETTPETPSTETE